MENLDLSVETPQSRRLFEKMQRAAHDAPHGAPRLAYVVYPTQQPRKDASLLAALARKMVGRRGA